MIKLTTLDIGPFGVHHLWNVRMKQSICDNSGTKWLNIDYTHASRMHSQMNQRAKKGLEKIATSTAADCLRQSRMWRHVFDDACIFALNCCRSTLEPFLYSVFVRCSHSHAPCESNAFVWKQNDCQTWKCECVTHFHCANNQRCKWKAHKVRTCHMNRTRKTEETSKQTSNKLIRSYSSDSFNLSV